MDKAAIYHRSQSEMAFLSPDGSMVFRLRSAAGDLSRVYLVYGDTAYPAKDVVFSEKEMELLFHTATYDYFEARVAVDIVRFVYAFRLIDKEGVETLYYGEAFHEGMPKDRNDLFKYPYVYPSEAAKLPSWLAKAVFYNVFPDSFVYPGIGRMDGPSVHHGGSLKAVTQALDYIRLLGCDSIYLNPIFKAGCYHRYDTEDYLEIEPELGSEGDLRELVEKAHERGMHVILDGVFNHCGPSFFAFRDVLEKQEKSRYAKWFHRLDFPIGYPPTGNRPRYATFGYEAHMPKLNLLDDEVREYFLRVVRKWIGEFHVDGFRMDTADECPPSFWKWLSSKVKEIDSEAVLIAETWQNPRPMVMDQGFDGAMDYDFRRAVISFLGGEMDAVGLSERVAYMMNRVDEAHLSGMMSLLSTHDVPRTYSLLEEDDAKMELGFLFQFAFPGPINLLYGDECGLTGITEDEYRKAMVYEKEPRFAGILKELSAIRKEYPALVDGNLVVRLAEDRRFVFERRKGEERVVIEINAGENEVPLITKGKTLLSRRAKEGRLRPMGFSVLLV